MGPILDLIHRVPLFSARESAPGASANRKDPQPGATISCYREKVFIEKLVEQQFTTDWFNRTKGIWSQLLTRHQPQRILEVGSFEGASICFCIQTLSPIVPSLEIHCVDTWEGGIEHQAGGMSEYNMPEVYARFNNNVQIEINRASSEVKFFTHREPSAVALSRLIAEGMSGYFDFIYIDGSHQAPDVLADAVLAFQLVKVGGLIVFDDYLWSEAGIDDVIRCPKIAIDSFTTIYSKKLRILAAPLYQLYTQKIGA
jgi:predicted O-methyltransferase YrrM